LQNKTRTTVGVTDPGYKRSPPGCSAAVVGIVEVSGKKCNKPATTSIQPMTPSPRHSNAPSSSRGKMRTNPPQTAVLFDIDGTLMDFHGVGREAFVQALEKVFGWRDEIAYIQFHGNTDLNVLREIFVRHGAELTAAKQRDFFAALALELEQRAAGAAATRHPGVAELLQALAADERVALGIVTGNIEATARIKLRKAGLHHHFPRGGYSDEHADRADIARQALARLRAALPPGAEFAAVWLVGDTPFDVAAAKAIGARCLAVATGRHSVGELRAAGADGVLENLADTAAVRRLLLP
jgi:phosphoglycolate phosphatase-like HAD superfamily hydrolase